MKRLDSDENILGRSSKCNFFLESRNLDQESEEEKEAESKVILGQSL